MYHTLGIRVSVNDNNTPVVSNAVTMAGANAVLHDLTVYHNSSDGPFDVKIEGSNDLENWIDLNNTIQVADGVVGYFSATSPLVDVGLANVRLTYIAAGNGEIVLDAGLTTFQE